MWGRLAGILLAAWLALFCAPLWAQQAAIPTLNAWVTDTTGTLDAAQKQALEERLIALQKRKGAQVAVLIVQSSAPETIEQYATRVFEKWKLGRKGTDDGVLLVFAMKDRAMHIEVGYGLEGAIPDALASRIIREQIIPRFQAGDFAAGVIAGVTAVETLIDGEPLPPPVAAPAPMTSDSEGESLPILGFAALAIFAFPALIGGLVAGFATWMLTGSLLIGVAGGVGGFLLSAVLGALGIKAVLLQLLGRGRGGGGGGGGFGGGGGGFGGGGGGRSGGGGASGRW